jgi:secreted PhoX family phosphatase
VVAPSTGTFYGQAMTAGDIYTIAGDGTAGFAGDSGPAISAELANPAAVAVNSAGDLLIVDDGNNRIREVTG